MEAIDSFDAFDFSELEDKVETVGVAPDRRRLSKRSTAGGITLLTGYRRRLCAAISEEQWTTLTTACCLLPTIEKRKGMK